MELEKYYGQLEAYHLGRMGPEEKEAFEANLRTDAELHQAWNLYRLSVAALELQKDAQVRETVNKVRKEEKKAIVVRRRYLALAASVALLLCAAGGLWFARQWYSDQALYQAFYTAPSELNPARMGEGEQASTPLLQGLEAYAGGQTDLALSLLDSIAPEQADYEAARFAVGQIYLQTGRGEEAIPYISPLTASLDSSRAARSEWYLALALLQTGKTAECREWLIIISEDPAHPYQAKAEELLKKMRSLWKEIGDL